MSSLSWITGEIELATVAATPDEIENVTEHPDAQVSLVHEYVHFMQVLTSVSGIRLLADLIDLGVRGGLLLSGTIQLGDVVQGYKTILPLLRDLPDRAWRGHEGVAQRRNETMDELEVMLEPTAHAYTGDAAPWTVIHQVVTHRTFDEPIWGFVVAGDGGGGPRFRPFSIGFLAETMARRLDRWFAAEIHHAHEWPAGRDEGEFYNGLLTLLERDLYREPLEGAPLEEIVVIIASLALATPRPDWATKLMLDRLLRPIDGGLLVANVAQALRAHLVAQRLHHADHYNEAISDIMWGVASIMDRVEYADIHRRLLHVHDAANRVLRDPLMFVKPQLDWAAVKAWMAWFPPPPIVAADHNRAAAVDGAVCEPFCTPFLSLVEAKLLAP
jgi:hypothetical protein